MKMKLTLLLLVSVFFCILVSCGMPTVFNLDSYSLQEVEPTIPNSVKGSLAITSSDPSVLSFLSDPDTIGPSLMFFYMVSSESLDPPTTETVISEFQSKFYSYVKKEPFGINNPEYHELIYKTLSDDKKVSLYGFTGLGNKKFSYPEYILSTNSQSNPEQCTFTLQAKLVPGQTTHYYVTLSVDSDSLPGSFQPTSIDLYGFEGASFLTDKDEISKIKTGEYGFLLDGTTKIYLNVFCAFSISGNFTNTFWSSLTYLGKIELPTS